MVFVGYVLGHGCILKRWLASKVCEKRDNRNRVELQLHPCTIDAGRYTLLTGGKVEFERGQTGCRYYKMQLNQLPHCLLFGATPDTRYSTSRRFQRRSNDRPAFRQEQPAPCTALVIVIREFEHPQQVGIRQPVNYSDLATLKFNFAARQKCITSGVDGARVQLQLDTVSVIAFLTNLTGKPAFQNTSMTQNAGDRSLVNVIAHEIAHSWTGNLVTNSSWEHFWLNEGHTMYLERLIMEKLHGTQMRHLLLAIGYAELIIVVKKPHRHPMRITSIRSWVPTSLNMLVAGPDRLTPYSSYVQLNMESATDFQRKTRDFLISPTEATAITHTDIQASLVPVLIQNLLTQTEALKIELSNALRSL
ncbi:hypothetical protein AHF37_07287 [Paragonimus kellicotti]|nr:hypothetical protein AHF37_07287 [Paragonimus kellicotti]